MPIKRRVLIRALRALPALMIAVMIFCFSQQKAVDSNGLSMRVSRFLLTNFAFVLQPDFHALSPGQQQARVAAYNAEVRELAHAGAFFLLAAALYLAVKRPRGQTVASRMLFAYALAAAFALADETHQLFIEGRAFQLLDIAVDLGGAGLAVMLAGLLSRPRAPMNS